VKAIRASVVACACALALAGTAHAGTSDDFAGAHRQVFPVYVVHGMTLGDLPQLVAEGAAVGVMVPNAGPRTSQAAAFAGMVRGILYNTRLPMPRESVLIRVRHTREIPSRGPAIVVGLPPATSAPNDRRYPIAVLGGGYEGLLVSSLTRVPGLVSIADVARTALQTPHALTWQRDGGPVATSLRLERQIDVARSTTMAGSVLVLCLLAIFALFFPRGAPSALGTAIGVNLALGWFPAGDAAPRVTLLGLCTVAGGIIGPKLFRNRTVLGLALVALLVAYSVSMLVRPSTLSLAPIGPELTSRFFGVSNLLESWLLFPALLGAGLLSQRFGWKAFVPTGALALATIAENKLGADGGGAIVVGVAFALLGVQLVGARRRYTLPALGIAGLVVLALVNIDAAASGPDHLRGAVHGGVNGVMNVAANRVPLAYARMVEQWWLLIPAATLLLVGLGVVRYGRARVDRAVVVALLGGLISSLLVNDSPGPVMIGGLTALLAMEGGLVHRTFALPVLQRLAPVVADALPQEP
jgi:hypothetical protein